VTTISWNFEGKTALITGASRGIGLAAAELLASAGAEVYALSRSGEPSAQSPRSHVLTVDVTSTEKLTRAAEDAASNTGRIDICIANAGVGFVEDYVHTNPVEWSRVIDVNLLGVMRVWQAVLPYMGNDGLGGRLIANSSAAGVRGELGTATYSASKAAIAGLVQSLAVEYADRAITVNAVAPGEIDTL
jgi:glucose 1-dehydrogenase